MANLYVRDDVNGFAKVMSDIVPCSIDPAEISFAYDYVACGLWDRADVTVCLEKNGCRATDDEVDEVLMGLRSQEPGALRILLAV